MPQEDYVDLKAILRLQIFVLALGESKHYNWWKCNFLSPTGISFLQRLYPRAYFWNAVRSSSIAACTIHDSSIGVGNVFHLFRLPREIDRALREIAPDDRLQLMAESQPVLGDKSKLIDAIKSLAGGEVAKAQPGPVKVGSVQDMTKKESIVRMASLYSAAFLNDSKTFPYFEGQRQKNVNR
ncbi:MAG: BrxE family protein [Chloroflexi bacterium]|nr:BrxE family protein [Chloroflexota bacterium]MCL5950292.1 BrxE family protein [Chloroflexota bacterium]